MTSQATRLLDAQTVLVGWINHSATDCYEHIRSSGPPVARTWPETKPGQN